MVDAKNNDDSSELDKRRELVAKVIADNADRLAQELDKSEINAFFEQEGVSADGQGRYVFTLEVPEHIARAIKAIKQSGWSRSGWSQPPVRASSRLSFEQGRARAAVMLPGRLSRNQDLGPVETHGLGRAEAPLPETPLTEPSARADDTLLTTAQFAQLVQLTPQAVRDQLKNKQVIGWRRGVKPFVLPREQLGPANQYIPELPRLLEFFDDPALAWLWLTQPNASTQGEKPLDRLHAGHIDEVLYAARLYDQGAFT